MRSPSLYYLSKKHPEVGSSAPENCSHMEFSMKTSLWPLRNGWANIILSFILRVTLINETDRRTKIDFTINQLFLIFKQHSENLHNSRGKANWKLDCTLRPLFCSSFSCELTDSPFSPWLYGVNVDINVVASVSSVLNMSKTKNVKHFVCSSYVVHTTTSLCKTVDNKLC